MNLSMNYKLLRNLLKLAMIPNLSYMQNYITQCTIYINDREGGIVADDIRFIETKLDRAINGEPAERILPNDRQTGGRGRKSG